MNDKANVFVKVKVEEKESEESSQVAVKLHSQKTDRCRFCFLLTWLVNSHPKRNSCTQDTDFPIAPFRVPMRSILWTQICMVIRNFDGISSTLVQLLLQFLG